MAEHSSVQLDTTYKSDDGGGMPASMVLLLIFLFTALGTIAYLHIKKDYLRQQTYKRVGPMLNTAPTTSYGSTFSPNLNSENIDEYIDDQLYGSNPIIERLNAYRSAAQERFREYMESTPQPVMYKRTDVEAYNKNPEIPPNPNYIAKPLQHTENYNPVPSEALQQIIERKLRKKQNQKVHGRKRRNSQEEVSMEYEEIKDVVHKQNKKKKADVSLTHRVMNCEDFSDDMHENMGGRREYDSIPDSKGKGDAYSDSDKRISDSDNGNGRMCTNDEPPLLTKVVVLDLD